MTGDIARQLNSCAEINLRERRDCAAGWMNGVANLNIMAALTSLSGGKPLQRCCRCYYDDDDGGGGGGGDET